MKDAPQFKPFQVLRKRGRIGVHFMCGYSIGVCWPMVPRECIHLSYGVSRFVFFERWVLMKNDWIVYCWNLRILWMMVGRHLPICQMSSLEDPTL